VVPSQICLNIIIINSDILLSVKVFDDIVKGGPKPLEKEIHKILGSKREDRFSDPFLKLVQKNSGSFFRTCFITVIYVRTRGHCESSRRSARR